LCRICANNILEQIRKIKEATLMKRLACMLAVVALLATGCAGAKDAFVGAVPVGSYSLAFRTADVVNV
jgi:hypothetical protein